MPKSNSKGRSGDAKEVFKHAERLKYQDEDWKARDEALERVGKLITQGALSCDGFVSGFSSLGSGSGKSLPVNSQVQGQMVSDPPSHALTERRWSRH